MPQETINVGAAPDDATGDTIRAGGIKINNNFTDLYTTVGGLGTAATQNITVASTAPGSPATGDLWFQTS